MRCATHLSSLTLGRSLRTQIRRPAQLLPLWGWFPLDGHQQAVPNGEHGRQQRLVVSYRLAELADRDCVVVALRGIGDAVVPQRVVECDDATWAEQPDGLPE